MGRDIILVIKGEDGPGASMGETLIALAIGIIVIVIVAIATHVGIGCLN